MRFKIKIIHHIKLTVSDLKKSKEFYQRLFGFKIVAEYSGFVMFYSGNFYLGLTDHKGDTQRQEFNEKDVGLDHVSFEVESKADLDKALSYFKQQNIPHGQVEKLSNNLYVLAFRDPDNIQLELAWRKK